MNYIHYYQSPLGEIILTSDGKSLTGLSYDFPEMLLPYFIEKPLPIFSETDRWLDVYFSGKNPDFTPKLSLKATGFRKMVWDILLTIPFGQTITYGEIASRIAKQRGIPRMSAQAVGGAVGHNPIALIIPCHRVVGANGSLTGYAGGIDKKEQLLRLEQVDMSRLFIPKRGTKR
ncbi:MAG: methylated-DNA--[Acidaminococcaceae bacterium]|nr:methylated-DNA--[protein]-cysteine S-methyltransferase [Acidaminococcaceae bacterium]MBR1696413.1 methylated-DNA--[protein]-cysteine S-methyltransferase [Selenomonas sp.]